MLLLSCTSNIKWLFVMAKGLLMKFAFSFLLSSYFLLLSSYRHIDNVMLWGSKRLYLCLAVLRITLSSVLWGSFLAVLMGQYGAGNWTGGQPQPSALISLAPYFRLLSKIASAEVDLFLRLLNYLVRKICIQNSDKYNESEYFFFCSIV